MSLKNAISMYNLHPITYEWFLFDDERKKISEKRRLLREENVIGLLK